jgi:hypothetical protein
LETKILISLVGAGATIVGAILGHISAAVQARYKLRELQLTYEQKLHENYLTSARQYTRNVYVPITLILTRLRREFDSFRRTFNPTQDEALYPSISEFGKAIGIFITELDALISQGAGAFLTAALERRLDSFRDFLLGSLKATEPAARVVFHYNIGLSGLYLENEIGSKVRLKHLPRWSHKGLTFSFLGLGIGYKLGETLEAPLGSEEFEARIVRDLVELSSLVKEVTLGAHSGPR